MKASMDACIHATACIRTQARYTSKIEQEANSAVFGIPPNTAEGHYRNLHKSTETCCNRDA